MKYKIIGLGAVLLSAAAVLSVSLAISGESAARYIQHVNAGEKQACELHSDGEFCTHLPIVKIDTNQTEIPGRSIFDENGKTIGYTTAADGNSSITATMGIIESGESNNHSSDTPTVSGNISIRVRGHSSRSFDKANYFIRLINSDGTNAPREILGMDSHHEWALHGPFLDKSLIRNYMWYNISGEIMDYSPNVRFCELILNGEYVGLYLMTETITAGRDGARLELSVDKKDNTFSGYALRLDWYDAESTKRIYPLTNYTKRAATQHEIVYPGEQNLTPELYEDIKNDFSAFEKALYSYDYKSKKYGYEHFIDVDSFADYFIVNEFTCNYDAGSLSTYIYKDVDGKYRMCVWDFNSACDFYQEESMPTDRFRIQDSLWFNMLIKDKEFTDRIIKRYRELRETYLSEEYLFDFIDSSVKYLGDSVARNYDIWGYTFHKEYDMLYPAERNPRSYEEAIAQLKDFIRERGEWMDENIDTLRQFSADSKVKKFNEISD